MKEKLTITAISGWAIPRSWYAEQIKQAFPNSVVQIVYPENPEEEEEAKYILNRYPSKLFIGYSLGSLWLLKHQAYLPPNCDKAILAPILAFLKKSNLGGKTSETQLEYLIKILKGRQSKSEVLQNFFFHANLPFPETQIDEIPDREILIKGLEFLKNNSVIGKETNDFLSIIGENDTFIDAESLKRHIPQLKILKGTGHSPTALLMQLAKILKNR
ncbi:MAG: hypothetical protein H8E32_09140 [Nitrospinae bacterium]|nr:hypothetical protein [Nitrospinota bacterium]